MHVGIFIPLFAVVLLEEDIIEHLLISTNGLTSNLRRIVKSSGTE